MFLVEFLTAFYVLIALLAAAMTYLEQRQTNQPRSIFTALGFVACALWPLTLVAIAVALTLDKA